MTNAYAKAGVDVDVEAEASRIMYEASKKTFANRGGKIGELIAPFDDFAGLKVVMIDNLPKGSCMSMGFDGAGTKVEIAQRIRRYRTIAFCLFAMLADDAVLRGGEPALVGSVLDIKTLGTDERYLPIIRELAEGYVAAAEAANVAVINGEIAQMGALVSGYGDFPFNWGGACIWYGKKDRLLSGMEIQIGDSVVLLQEKGPRANGISLLRKIYQSAYGDLWHEAPFGEGSTLGEAVLEPCTIYARLIVYLHGGFEEEPACKIHGLAHITGGGIPEKMGRILRPSGLGAKFTDLYDPPAIVQHCQEIGQFPDEDLYRAFGGGHGMAVITPQPDHVIAAAAAHGVPARNAGRIVKEPGIRLVSKGLMTPGKLLPF